MIHAYLFLVTGSTDRDGHGSDFQTLMTVINIAAGSNITIYHSFHNEVNYYKTHVWRCNGACKNKPPFYGWIRRSMNRPPQLSDYWFNAHKQTCGGTFTKILEPPNGNSQLGKCASTTKTTNGRCPGRVLGTNGHFPADRKQQLLKFDSIKIKNAPMAKIDQTRVENPIKIQKSLDDFNGSTIDFYLISDSDD